MANYPGQFPALQFPSDPTEGQDFVADNGVTYIWTGDRWSSALGITNGKAKYVYDGLYSNNAYDPLFDNELDGNGAY